MLAMIKQKVGARIRELRNDRGLSQEKLALAAGLDRTYIASVENGKRNMNNRIETVECFMRYLGEQENHEPRVVLNQLGSIVQDIKNKGMDADIRNIKDKMGLS